MQVIGYKKSDFRAKDGTEVKGFNIYLMQPVSSNGEGMEVDRIYLTEAKIGKMGISLPDLMNQNVALSYNRWGKVETITVISK